MVEWPSAFSISTDFHVFPYQRKTKKLKQCRNRERLTEKENRHLPDKFDYNNEKKEPIRGPPAKRAG